MCMLICVWGTYEYEGGGQLSSAVFLIYTKAGPLTWPCEPACVRDLLSLSPSVWGLLVAGTHSHGFRDPNLGS